MLSDDPEAGLREVGCGRKAQEGGDTCIYIADSHSAVVVQQLYSKKKVNSCLIFIFY